MMKTGAEYADTGTAARFFFSAKASRSERGEGNNHPTVKPLALMRWLCRLVTPTGGTVLDPFAGSGSTLIAADREGFSAIGIERESEYVEIARRRLAADAPLLTGAA
jgi:site-specific DNA-methyltransferase (adenine-specific)